MTFYSLRGSYPCPIPFRISLSDGRTRTDPSSFTAEEIADAGYIPVEDMPILNSVQIVEWDSVNVSWIIRDKTLEESQAETKAVWASIRQQRDNLINSVTWRYERYARHDRLGLPQIDDIADLDTYIQALADVPQSQNDPYDIVWPILKSNE